MPSIRQLKLLIALVETGSVTAAAEQIGITQPAASKSLTQLQDLAGFKIYDKRNNRIELTQKGASLFQEAGRLVRIADEFNGIMGDIREKGAQRIRIATTQSIFSSSALAESLKEFSDRYPNVRFELEALSRVDLIRTVELDRTDLAIAYGPILSKNVVSQEFATSSICAVAKKGGLLRGKSSLTAKELTAFPIILFFARSRHRKMIDNYFEQAAVTPNIFAEVANASATLTLAQTGAAVGVCDTRYVMDHGGNKFEFCGLGEAMALKLAFVERRNSEPSEYIRWLKAIISSNWQR